MKKVLHVGLDVDDKSFHIGAFCKETGEIFEKSSKPNLGSLMRKLELFTDQDFELKLCYEATYIGYTLCRDLRNAGYEAEIIAPSLIPEVASNRVKTDRLDAKKLAKYYANEMLTPIHIPGKEEEVDRSLLRSRRFILDQRKVLRRHILSACRTIGLHYKLDTGAKHHWTKRHENWLTDNVNKLEGTARLNFEILLRQLEKLDEGISEYDKQIEVLSEDKRYKIQKDALNCFRGISTLTAMTFITEIGDVRRFKHPKQLTSYCGLDVIEYSSGGKEKKFGITKMGNERIRTSAIEACQLSHKSKPLSKRLKAHRRGQNMEVIDIADRCTKRLKKKSKNLLEAGKHTNKVKVACAREFLGFVWEALHKVA